MVRIRNIAHHKLSCPDLVAGKILVIKPGQVMDIEPKQYQILSRLYSYKSLERMPEPELEPVPDNVRLGPGTPIKKRTKKK